MAVPVPWWLQQYAQWAYQQQQNQQQIPDNPPDLPDIGPAPPTTAPELSPTPTPSGPNVQINPQGFPSPMPFLPSPTPTSTPDWSNIPSGPPSVDVGFTPSPTATFTPTPTSTPTDTPTPTPSATFTPTPSPTYTPTPTPSATFTPTPTPSATSTPTPTPTATSTPTPSATAAPMADGMPAYMWTFNSPTPTPTPTPEATSNFSGIDTAQNIAVNFVANPAGGYWGYDQNWQWVGGVPAAEPASAPTGGAPSEFLTGAPASPNFGASLMQPADQWWAGGAGAYPGTPTPDLQNTVNAGPGLEFVPGDTAPPTPTEQQPTVSGQGIPTPPGVEPDSAMAQPVIPITWSTDPSQIYGPTSQPNTLGQPTDWANVGNMISNFAGMISNFAGDIGNLFTTDPTPGIAPSGFPVGSFTPDAVASGLPLAGSFAGLGQGGGGNLGGYDFSRGLWEGKQPLTEENFNNMLGWMNYQGSATGLTGPAFSGLSYQDYVNMWNAVQSKSPSASGQTDPFGSFGQASHSGTTKGQ